MAYLEGTLAVYDLSTRVLRHSCRHEVKHFSTGLTVLLVAFGPDEVTTLPSFLQVGIVHLQWEESSSVVSTCCLDGKLRLWDARSGNLVSEYCGHTAEILDFTLNRCSKPARRSRADVLLECAHCGFQFQGGVCGGDGVRGRPGQSLLSPKA